jgi:tRNA threonylcarbamoyladenosine biosynthesis protein TsaB
MKILAFELSSAQGSLALLTDSNVNVLQEWPNDRKNSGPFFQSLADVQKQFGKAETIIVGLGPGSYAGVRIAISAAIGLSFAGRTGSVPSEDHKLMGRHGGRPSKFETRLIGYPSICAIETEEREYCMVGDARRQTFFFARVCDNNLMEGPMLVTEPELSEKLAKLDRSNMSIFASENLPQFERVTVRYPSAKVLAQLAGNPKRTFANGPLEPIYLREPHITLPKPSGP